MAASWHLQRSRGSSWEFEHQSRRLRDPGQALCLLTHFHMAQWVNNTCLWGGGLQELTEIIHVMYHFLKYLWIWWGYRNEAPFLSHSCFLLCVVRTCFSILCQSLWQMMDTSEFPFFGSISTCFLLISLHHKATTCTRLFSQQHTLASVSCLVAQKCSGQVPRHLRARAVGRQLHQAN